MCTSIWGLFVLSMVFPELLWSMSYVHSMGLLGYGSLAISGVFVASSFLLQNDSPLIQKLQEKVPVNDRLLILGLVLSFALLFALYPIYSDLYGDARYIKEELNIVIPKWSPALLTDLFYFHPLDSKIGTRTAYSLANLTAYLFGVSGNEAIRLLNVFWGAMFVGAWVYLVKKVLRSNAWQTIWILAGITAPWTLAFAGHYEIYAPSFFLQTVFCIQLWRYFEAPGLKRILWLGLVLLFCIKFHVTSYLLGISLGFVVAHWIQFKNSQAHAWHWKKVALYAWLPFMLLGAVVYLFVFQSFHGPRNYSPETLNEVLFLPVISSEPAPLDRYNLFSLIHMMDYFNLVVSWSPLGLALILGLVVEQAKKISWNSPLVIISTTQAMVYMGAFFVLNPLLSPQVDWDLFSLPAISFLFFGMVLTGQVADFQKGWNFVPAAIGISLLSLSTIYTHSQPQMLAKVYETRGLGTFKSYWIGSSTLLHESARLQASANESQAKRLDILEKLLPFSTPNNDLEYADLLVEAGKYYFDSKDYEKAIGYFEEAFAFDPSLIRNTYYLVVTQFSRKQYKDAHTYGNRLVAYQYPSQKKACRIAIHVAVEAEAYENALTYCTEYLEVFPEDEFIQRVRNRLAQKNDLANIRRMFRVE